MNPLLSSRGKAWSVPALLWAALLLCVPLIAAGQTYQSIASGSNDALPTNGSAGNLTITKPAGTASGDVMLATISARPSAMTITAPSGWTLYQRTEQPNGGSSTAPGGMSLLTYYKAAGGSEPANYTWTLANPQNDGGGVAGTVMRVSGVDTLNPIDVYVDALSGNGLTHSAPSVTTTVPNTLLVASVTYLSSRNFGAPSGITGITERAEVRAPTTDNAIGVTLLVATVAKATAGATGSVSATAAGDADYGMGHMFALAAPRPDLALAMTRTGNLDPGTTTSYFTLVASNIGTVAESGTVTVTTTLPANVSYTDNSGSDVGWSCGSAGSPVVVTCTRSGLAASATSSLRLNVSVGASASGTLTTTASVAGAANNDGNTSNNTGTNTYTITPQGCTTSTVGSDTVVTCTSDGTITIPANVSTVRYLVVAGGGGGGGIDSGSEDGAGGGGAGGVRYGNSFTVTAGASYSVVVGAGGTAGTGAANGGNGGNSTFSTLTATGGGGGAREGGQDGLAGGSGGGGSDNDSGGAGTAGQGNSGGNGNNDDAGGGGGGASATGQNGGSNDGGNGGSGISNDITGTATYYGGGGGGGADDGATGGTGGVGGGATAPSGRGPGVAGTANTGGGGSGATGSSSGSAYSGGAGGSGIVILRYNTSTSCATFRDEFSSTSYSLNAGTANWSGSWTETGDNDSASNGDIQIGSNRLQFESDAADNTSLYREANLSSYSSATLSFDYSESGWDSGDTLQVRVSSNGGSSWTTIHTFNGDQGSGGSFSQDISAYIASNFRIAFVITSADGGSDKFYIDNVQIDACSGASGPDHIRVFLDNSTTALTCTPRSVSAIACADASCTTRYTSTVDVALSPGGTAATIPVSGTGTPTVKQTSAGSASITLSSSNPTTSGGTAFRCYEGTTASPGTEITGACNVTFNNAGFFVSVPDHASCTTQTLTITAAKADDQTKKCVPAFDSGASRDIKLRFAFGNPTSGTIAPTVGSAAPPTSALATGSDLTLAMTFTGGVATTNFRYQDAGSLTVSASYTGSDGTGDAGLSMATVSNPAFVVRPSQLAVTSAVNGSGTPNPGTTTTAGAIFTAAGDGFTVKVQATNSCGAVTPNFGNETTVPSVTFVDSSVATGKIYSLVVPTANTPSSGTLTVGTPTNGNGSGVTGTVAVTGNKWSEVGAITLKPYLANYLSSGSAVTGVESGTIGRFSPYQYAVSGTLTQCGTAFAYAGQPLTGTLTVTAQDKDGNTTTNYGKGAASLATLTAGELTLGGVATGLAVDTASSLYSVAFATNQDFDTLHNGTAQVDVAVPVKMTGAAAPLIAPITSALQVTASTDEVTQIAGAPVNLLSDGAGGTTIAFRAGRLRLFNKFGSEKQSLLMPVQVQYWGGNSWVLSNDDTCTGASLLPGVVALSNYTAPASVDPALASGNLDTSHISGFTADGGGKWNLTLTAPDLVDGKSPTGSVDVTATVPAWLKLNGADPKARATFGIYAPETRKSIHVRELF